MSAPPALGRKDSWIEVGSHGEMGTASSKFISSGQAQFVPPGKYQTVLLHSG